MEKYCLFCGLRISPALARKTNIKYCSPECQKASAKQRYNRLNPKPKVSASIQGAMSELRVAVDLLSKGYNVFRAVSPSCPCDLAIMKDDRLLKIEVTTGKYTSPDTVLYPPHNQNNYDIIAAVLHDQIYYFPDLPQ